MAKPHIAPYLYRCWEKVLSTFFIYRSRRYALTRKAHTKRHSCSSAALYEFAKGFKHYSKDGLICHVTREANDVAFTKKVFRHVLEDIQDPEAIELVTAELIAKLLAYRSLDRDEEICIPTGNEQGSFSLVSYIVMRKFDLWGKVRAYGLVPKKDKEAAPLLLFRGTDPNLLTEGGRNSMLSDLDPKGPGRALYLYAKDALHAWLQSVCNGKRKARLYGHSLGGAFVTYALIQEHAYISQKKHEPSYAFNFPGVCNDLLEQWHSIPESKRPNFIGFVTRGDVVSKFGSLFGSIFELSLPKRLPPILSHEHLHFSHTDCFMQHVDISRENRSRSRKFYSSIAQKTSRILYNFGLKYLFPQAK